MKKNSYLHQQQNVNPLTVGIWTGLGTLVLVVTTMAVVNGGVFNTLSQAKEYGSGGNSTSNGTYYTCGIYYGKANYYACRGGKCTLKRCPLGSTCGVKNNIPCAGPPRN